MEENADTPDLFLIQTSSNNPKNKLQEAIYAELRHLHAVLVYDTPEAICAGIKDRVDKLNRHYHRCAAHDVGVRDYGDPSISVKIPMTESGFMTLSLKRVKEARASLWEGGDVK